jgi:hypothetical protein
MDNEAVNDDNSEGLEDIFADLAKEEESIKKPSRKYGQYSSQDLESAVKEVKTGTLKLASAARKYKVPRKTVHVHLNKKISQKCGSETILNAEDEKRIADWIIDCAEMGDPRTKTEVLNAAGNKPKLIHKVSRNIM